jgi:hypothetical protein
MRCCRDSSSFAASCRSLESAGGTEPRQPGVDAGEAVPGVAGGAAEDGAEGADGDGEELAHDDLPGRTTGHRYQLLGRRIRAPSCPVTTAGN